MKRYITDLKYKLFALSLKISRYLSDDLDLSDITILNSLCVAYEGKAVIRGEIVERPEYVDVYGFLDPKGLYGNYGTRHKAAAVLIEGYINSTANVSKAELRRCAKIMLEGIKHTYNNESQLMGIWTKQRRGTIKTDDSVFTQEENRFFNKLISKKR